MQLAEVDLQNIIQKQQQTLQMMSNISNILHLHGAGHHPEDRRLTGPVDNDDS